MRNIQYLLLALALTGAGASRAAAQDAHAHTTAEMAQKQNAQTSAMLERVRLATARYKDVRIAESEGYTLQFGCVVGDYGSAMGLHYVNGDLVNKGVLDLEHPQIIIYEPTPSGELKLTGVDYLLIASAWDAKKIGPPQLMGNLFHLFETPNRFGLPAFYTLHVWAWKDNPNGATVNWHPKVSCDSYATDKP
jgi:hypothetical protein